MPELKKLNLRIWLQSIDWKLFVFLLLVLNVKLVLKVIALLIIYLLRPDFRFGFSLKKTSRLPLFYVLIIGITLLNWIFNGNFFSTNYNLVMLTGLAFWMLCILAIHQMKLVVDTTPLQIVHNTVLLFFITNVIFSFLNLALIIGETGALNPFLYQGMHQKYFIGTGDAIRGITFDTSTTNALISTFGVIYSLKKSKFFITLICMAGMLVTGSNFTNVLLLAALLFLLIFQSDRNQKSIIVVCSFMLVIFLTKVSPQNGTYIAGYFQKKIAALITKAAPVTADFSILEKPDSLLSADEKKQKTAMLYLDSLYKARLENDKRELAAGKLPGELPFEKPSVPKPNIHTEAYQMSKDTTLFQKRLLVFEKSTIGYSDTSLPATLKSKGPGKLVALRQTIKFFDQHPARIFTGTGIGNFSSKLAFRATGLGMAGSYPAKYIYVNDDFKNNHLRLYLTYFTKHMELHSLTHTPNSVYDQLLGEYGLAGLLSFVFFYFWFFIRHLPGLTYGVPLLIILLGALGAEYWFEQLSIVILFELLLFLDMKSVDQQPMVPKETLT